MSVRVINPSIKTGANTKDQIKIPDSSVSGIENYQKIGSGVCYDTSTSDTAGTWTVTIPNITALTEGLTVKVRLKTSYNSTTNTLNVNGLGAKTVYFRYGSKLTSHYAKESVLALTYTANAIGSGTDTSGWIVENIYDSTNTYQLRVYNTRPKTKSALYRYMICFVNNDGLLIPANNTSNSTATTKTLTTESFNLFDSIYYYNSTTTISANGQVGTGTLYTQLGIDLRYSFNTGTTLVAPNGVYLKVTADGSQFKLASTPITQSLPTSDDGYFYCYLGRAYSTYQIELVPEHPIYLYKNGIIQEYSAYAKSVAENAVKKSGDTMTGNLTIQQGNSINVSQYNDAGGTSLMNNGDGTATQFGSSARPARMFSSVQPEWYKNGASQGVLALKSDIPTDYVPNTRKVNNKALSSDITLGASDVGALSTAGGTVTGNLTVGGNLTINGTTTTVDSTTLQVKDKLIEVAHGNTTTLTTPAGLVAPKYDGTNSGALVFDSTGTAYVGDVTLKDGNIDVTNSGLQPLATRTGLVGGNLVQYDSSAQTLKDSGKKISDLALKTDIPDISGKLSKTENTGVNVLGTTKSTTTLGSNQLVAPNGIIISGTAANAGLTTRGICGVTSPDSTGACTKDNLYINYDGTNTYNTGRMLILQAGETGTDYGNNMYQYAVPRGDIVKAWVEAQGYAKTTQIPTVNNGTLTIQKNGTNVQTFTANQSSSVTANITVPTKVSELTNDSGFITSAPANYTTSSRTPSQCTANGFYYVSSSVNSLTDANGNPFLQYHTSNNDFRILATAYSDSWVQQIATDFRSTHIYYRIRNNGTWGAWTEVAKISDIPDVSGKANLSGGNTFTGKQLFNNTVNGVTNQLALNETQWDIFTCRDLTTPTMKTAIGKGFVWCQDSDAIYSQFKSTGIYYGNDTDGYDGTLKFPTSISGEKTIATTDQIPTFSLSGTTLTITLP